MKLIAYTCKICGTKGTAKCADDYEHDPLKLIKMLTCSRCYDLRQERITTTSRIYRICETLARADVPNREAHEARLSLMLKTYAKIIAKINFSDTELPVEEVQEALIAQPRKANDILAHFRSAIATTKELYPTHNDQ